MELAENLILVGKPITPRRRGRPSAEQLPIAVPPVKKNKVDSVQPSKDYRFDRLNHIPHFDTHKNSTKCKNEMYKRTYYYCKKCDRLCLVKISNCFEQYHKE